MIRALASWSGLGSSIFRSKRPGNENNIHEQRRIAMLQANALNLSQSTRFFLAQHIFSFYYFCILDIF